MKHCPTCQLVYDDHSVSCDRCGGPLADFDPKMGSHGHNLELPEGAAWVVLERAVDEIDAQSHVDFLLSRHIPAIRRLNKEGETMEIYFGNSIYGFDIYVPERLFEEAKEALEAFLEVIGVETE